MCTTVIRAIWHLKHLFSNYKFLKDHISSSIYTSWYIRHGVLIQKMANNGKKKKLEDKDQKQSEYIPQYTNTKYCTFSYRIYLTVKHKYW
jgi:hypothetical protein